MRLIKMPPWNLTNKLPAFHDVESASSVQMTAKLYEYMRIFQTDYEKFVEEINNAIDEYNTEINTDQKCFEEKATKIIHDYIHIIDTKLAHQDREIEEAIVYIKENLAAGITSILEQMKESGELTTALTNAFDTLGERVTELELDYTEVMETLGSANQNIYNNQNRIISLEDRAAGIEERASSLEGNATSLEDRIATNENDIENIETRVTTNETNIESLHNLGIKTGVLTGIEGKTTVSSSTYFVCGDMVILSCVININSNINQYEPIAKFENVDFTKNSYIYTKDGNRCFISSTTDTLNYYHVGGLTTGSTVEICSVGVLAYD